MRLRLGVGGLDQGARHPGNEQSVERQAERKMKGGPETLGFLAVSAARNAALISTVLLGVIFLHDITYRNTGDWFIPLMRHSGHPQRMPAEGKAEA